MSVMHLLSPDDPELRKGAARALTTPTRGSCLAGLDGFRDHIYRAIETRGTEGVTWIPTIAAFAQRLPASGSVNIELDPRQVRIGGNAPQLAQGLLALGERCTLVGALGWPTLDPLFEPLQKAGAELYPVAPVAHTYALEFQDGKLMLGEMPGLQEITPATLQARLPTGYLPQLWGGAYVAALVNWTMVPGMTALWRSLAPLTPYPAWVFVDLCEPIKRPGGELRDALEALRQLPSSVLLGLNLKEAEQVGSLMGLHPPSHGGEWARALRSALGLTALVLHSRDWCALATDSDAYWMPVRLVEDPITLTGAGDHFNAGCLAALLHGAPWEVILWMGLAAARHYIATGSSACREALT